MTNATNPIDGGGMTSFDLGKKANKKAATGGQMPLAKVQSVFIDNCTNISRNLAILVKSGKVTSGTTLLITTKDVTAIAPNGTKKLVLEHTKGDYMDIVGPSI